ncbi:SHOCT domain-containing protein [Halobacillus rhizosphaerae]|uniref:SHOCT domain-containing protein n=1 Tax=Halobacillus rhizosphaerae TaxID=3064889 RepID=UPI00398B5B19
MREGMKGFFNKAKTAYNEAQQEIQKKDQERKQKRNIAKKKKSFEMSKWFGENPSFTQKNTFSLYKETFDYIEHQLLSEGESVINVIEVRYNKTMNLQPKGLLLCTKLRLLFIHRVRGNQLIEEFSFSRMRDIVIADKGTASLSIVIKYDNSTTFNFDKVIDSNDAQFFVYTVKNVLNKSVSKPSGTGSGNKKSNNQKPIDNNEKYKMLEKVADLKEKGILSEEEFQMEKNKILNN